MTIQHNELEDKLAKEFRACIARRLKFLMGNGHIHTYGYAREWYDTLLNKTYEELTSSEKESARREVGSIMQIVDEYIDVDTEFDMVKGIAEMFYAVTHPEEIKEQMDSFSNMLTDTFKILMGKENK